MKPIIFSTRMVQAILDGRKTQTRRIVKPRYSDSVFIVHNGELCETEPPTPPIDVGGGVTRHKVRQFVPCKPRYQVGDVLYVRETFRTTGVKSRPYAYRADDDCGGATLTYEDGDSLLAVHYRWEPSIHMPREAARIFLRVTGARVERVQDITEKDARAEGIKSYWLHMEHGGEWNESNGPPFVGASDTHHTRKEAFAELWDSINAKRDDGAYAWAKNPWVFAYAFEPCDRLEG